MGNVLHQPPQARIPDRGKSGGTVGGNGPRRREQGGVRSRVPFQNALPHTQALCQSQKQTGGYGRKCRIDNNLGFQGARRPAGAWPGRVCKKGKSSPVTPTGGKVAPLCSCPEMTFP